MNFEASLAEVNKDYMNKLTQIGLSSEQWHIAEHREAEVSVQALNTGDKVIQGVSVHLICRHRTGSRSGMAAVARWPSRPRL